MNVYLEEKEHKYINKINNRVYTSVTTILNKFENHFDEYYNADRIFNKPESQKKDVYKNLSINQILKLWEKENHEANDYGSKIHLILETYFKKKKFFFPKDDFEKNIISNFSEIDPIKSPVYHPERILYSDEYNIAGMSDMIEDYDNNYFNVWDYKTNKKFNFFSEYGNFLLPPFDYLTECQYTIYSLQLSVYAKLYSLETGKKPLRLGIIYFDKNKNNFQIIPVIYLKREANIILKYSKTLPNKYL
jgi:hypothetical protein